MTTQPDLRKGERRGTMKHANGYVRRTGSDRRKEPAAQQMLDTVKSSSASRPLEVGNPSAVAAAPDDHGFNPSVDIFIAAEKSRFVKQLVAHDEKRKLQESLDIAVALLLDCRDYLRNSFEPDNQCKLYYRIDTYLKEHGK
jgi:hypothetical protein